MKDEKLNCFALLILCRNHFGGYTFRCFTDKCIKALQQDLKGLQSVPGLLGNRATELSVSITQVS